MTRCLMVWALGLAFLGTLAVADIPFPVDYATSPPFLHEVQGTNFAGSPTQNGTFDFTPGVAKSCKESTADTWLIFHCALSPSATLSLQGPLSNASYELDDEWIFVKPQTNGDTLWQYTLYGTWSGEVNGTVISSKTQMVAWAYASQPSHVKGRFTLLDEGAGVTLDGTQSYPITKDPDSAR